MAYVEPGRDPNGDPTGTHFCAPLLFSGLPWGAYLGPGA
jgi:hypothetical protein